MVRRIMAIGLFLTNFIIINAAHAATVNVQFSGVITNVTNPSGLLTGSGITASGPSPSTFTGITSYDPSLTPFSVGPSAGGIRAFYRPVTTVVTVDGIFNFSFSDIYIIDDYTAGTGSDKFWKSTGGGSPNFAFPVPAGSFNVSLFDAQGSVFSNTSLPTSLNLNDFETRSINIIGRNTGNTVQYTIDGTITTLSATVIPIPAAFWLFVSGLVALLGSRRRS